MDQLRRDVQEAVKRGEARGESRRTIFSRLWELAHRAAHRPGEPLPAEPLLARAAIPYLNEPWYC